MKAVVDSHIDLTGFSDEQIQKLKTSLEIPNPDKERAVREHLRGAHMIPDEIVLWKENSDGLRVPRGIGDELEGLLKVRVSWEDQRVEAPIKTSLWRNPILREHQEKALVDLECYEQGIYQAPPGSGKTVTLLELVRRLGQRSLVIVEKGNIAEQWRDRAREHLGLTEVGFIGDGVWEEADLTIAMQQTLWSRRNSLAGWWRTWGLVCLDECHHVSAETFYDIIQRFPARYRFGLSATPNKQAGRSRLVRASIGPTLHVTEQKMKGSVKVVPTTFKFAFWPTHRSYVDPNTEERTCEHKARGCNRKGLTHRNNWTDLVKALVEDDERNDTIAGEVAAAYRQGRAVIVLSRQIKHLDYMAQKVVARIGTEDVYRLSGKEKIDERMRVAERASEGKIVIFSTIADEALDIPRLDTAVLAFPAKNQGLVEQQIGRIGREMAEKAAPLVIDFEESGVLKGQLKERMKVYQRKGLTFEGC